MASKCPICSRVREGDQYKPFCSRRCADVDLARWLGGTYAVPAEEATIPDARENDEEQ